VAAWEYTVIPSGEWDFMLIDGPATTREVGLSCDLIRLAPRLSPGAAGFIDHRCRTAILARQLIGREFRFRFIPSLESFVFEKAAGVDRPGRAPR
jgi:hypothetical protein